MYAKFDYFVIGVNLTLLMSSHKDIYSINEYNSTHLSRLRLIKINWHYDFLKYRVFKIIVFFWAFTLWFCQILYILTNNTDVSIAFNLLNWMSWMLSDCTLSKLNVNFPKFNNKCCLVRVCSGVTYKHHAWYTIDSKVIHMYILSGLITAKIRRKM